MENNEQWLPIPGYKGFYSASSLGKIRREERKVVNLRGTQYTIKAKLLTQKPNKAGYIYNTFCIDRTEDRQLVHRVIYQTFIGVIPEGKEVDHINNIKSDNSVNNLRSATRSQNIANTNRVGVYFCKNTRKWRATISKDYKNYSLGRFINKTDAVKVYQEKRKELYGDYAYDQTEETLLALTNILR